MISEKTFGYGYDLWMFCVGGKDISPEALSDNKLQCRTHNYSGRDSFAFPFCDSEGCFCDFVSVQDELGGTVFIKESEANRSSYFAVPWRDENELNDVKHITVDEEYKESINKAIDRALDLSPVRKLYLNIRCQCRDKANMIGMLSADEMKALITADDLLGNIVYVLYDPITPSVLFENLGISTERIDKDEALGLWREIFCQSITNEMKANTPNYNEDFCWHVFSFGLLPAEEGAVADGIFDGKNKSDLILFFEHTNEAYLLKNAAGLTSANIKRLKQNVGLSLTDVYIFDRARGWTYVVTHEMSMGPYFFDSQAK